MAFVLALYEGKSIGSLELIEVSTDAGITEAFAEVMLKTPGDEDSSSATAALAQGRRNALRLVGGRERDEER